MHDVCRVSSTLGWLRSWWRTLDGALLEARLDRAYLEGLTARDLKDLGWTTIDLRNARDGACVGRILMHRFATTDAKATAVSLTSRHANRRSLLARIHRALTNCRKHRQAQWSLCQMDHRMRRDIGLDGSPSFGSHWLLDVQPRHLL